jgi:membrane protein
VLPNEQALPSSERQLAGAHRNRFGGLGDGRASVRGHIVRPLVVVHPVAGFGRHVAHPAAQIAKHVRIRVLLNDQARGRVLYENRAQGRLQTTTPHHRLYLAGHIGQAATGRANFHDFLIGTQLAADYAIIRVPVPAPESRRTSSPTTGRLSLRGLELEGLERRLDELSRRHRVTHVAFMLGQILVRRDIAGATSAMAFDLFLAAIPMLALSGWLFGRLLSNHESVLQTTALLLNLTPSEVQAMTWQQLDRFAPAGVAPFALLGALWIASGAFHTSMTLLEASAGTVPRPWWRKRLLAMISVLVSIALFGACALLAVWVSGSPARLLAIVSYGTAELDPGVTHWLLLLLLAALGVLLLALFFFFASPRPGVRRRVFPGAVLAVLAGSAVSAAFAFYAGHLARFALFYGSLAAVAVTLAWLWFVCFSVLIGAELNQLLENGE